MAWGVCTIQRIISGGREFSIAPGLDGGPWNGIPPVQFIMVFLHLPRDGPTESLGHSCDINLRTHHARVNVQRGCLVADGSCPRVLFPPVRSSQRGTLEF